MLCRKLCNDQCLVTPSMSVTLLLLLAYFSASSPEKVLEKRFQEQRKLGDIFSTLEKVKRLYHRAKELKLRYGDPVAFCKENACAKLGIKENCTNWESVKKCAAENVTKDLCEQLSLLCGTSCHREVLSSIQVDYTPFKHFASLPIQNAYLLSRLAALHSTGLPDFTKEPFEEVGSPTSDGCSKGHNLFDMGNLIFVTRARATILTDSQIFAAGTCLGDGQLPPKSQCYYMYRRVANDRNTPKDINHHYSVEEPELAHVQDWYTTAYNYTQQRLKTQGQLLRNVISGSLLPGGKKLSTNSEPMFLEYHKSLWTKPYFDCDLGQAWMVTYSAPVVYSVNGTVEYIGMTAIDIALNHTDINQCEIGNAFGFDDVFQGTHLCDEITTECKPIQKQGFTTGAYQCVCRRGYYRPDAAVGHHFNGSEIENELEKKAGVNWRTNLTASEGIRLVREGFTCLACPPGCDVCHNGTEKCLYESRDVIFIVLTVINVLIMLVVAVLMVFVINYRTSYAVRSASWPFLLLILIGSFLAYIGLLTKIDVADASCIAAPMFIFIGFACTFGSIIIKTWRIKEIFSMKMIRKKQKRRLSNKDLAVRLAFIITIYTVLLGLWLISGNPRQVEDQAAGLKYKRCSVAPVDWVLVVAEFILILPGIYFTFKLRNVIEDFAEQKQIIISVYFFTLVKIVVIVAANSLDQKPDIVYLISSLDHLLTFGVTVGLWFVPKVHKVLRPNLKDMMEHETKRHGHLTRNNSARWARRNGMVSLEFTHRDSYNQVLAEDLASVDGRTKNSNHLTGQSAVSYRGLRRGTWSGSPHLQSKSVRRSTTGGSRINRSAEGCSIPIKRQSLSLESTSSLPHLESRRRITSITSSLKSLRGSFQAKSQNPKEKAILPQPQAVGEKGRRHTSGSSSIAGSDADGDSIRIRPDGSCRISLSPLSSPEVRATPRTANSTTAVFVFPPCNEPASGTNGDTSQGKEQVNDAVQNHWRGEPFHAVRQHSTPSRTPMQLTTSSPAQPTSTDC